MTSPRMVCIIDAISTHSLAVGFSRMGASNGAALTCITPNPATRRPSPRCRVANGIGVTVMAAALKHVAGLAGPRRSSLRAALRRCGVERTDPLGLQSVRRRTDRGTLHGQRTVTPLVAVVDADSEGVTIDPPPELMALGATASSSLRLDPRRSAPRHQYRICRGSWRVSARRSCCCRRRSAQVSPGRGYSTGAADTREGPAVGRTVRVRAHRSDRSSAQMRRNLYDLAVGLGETPVPRGADPPAVEQRHAGGRRHSGSSRPWLVVPGMTVSGAANRRLREAAFPAGSISIGRTIAVELTRYE